MIVRRILISFGAILLSSFALSAQETVEAFPWSRIDHNPASMGMGTASYADPSAAAWASFRNSAIIPLSASTASVASSWTGWMPSSGEGMSHQIGIGTAFRFGKTGLSIGAAYMPGHPYDVMYESGLSGGEFTPSDMQAGVGLAFAMTDRLSIGFNGRFLTSSLAPDRSYTAFAGDLGVAAGFGPVTAALGISNLGTPVKSNDGTSYPLPASVSAGLTWMQDFADIHSVKVSADADYFLAGHLTAALGAQYCYNRLVSARVGYHLGTDQSVLPSFLTLGLGVQFAGFALDVSYLTANEQLGGTLCAGIRISF